MAYADQKMSGGKITAMVIVALIHVALGYAFVTGLAYQYVKKAAEDLNAFDVEEPPPPPPDEPPPPPPDVKFEPPPVVAPPPLVQTNIAPPVQIQSVPTPPPVFVPTPTAPPAPPPPPRVNKAAGLRGNPAQYFSSDNYPPAAARAGAQGRVVARLQVGADGRVAGCAITTSSGNSDLDDTTCRIARSRIKFTPAQDENGNAIASNYTLPVRWVLPE